MWWGRYSYVSGGNIDPDPHKNICTTSRPPCNTCDACCHSYIPPGPGGCDRCVEEQCQAGAGPAAWVASRGGSGVRATNNLTSSASASSSKAGDRAEGGAASVASFLAGRSG
jgi:hypothetical protein